MRVLILGGAGMLGHKLVQALAGEFDTWTTLRGAVGRVRAVPPDRSASACCGGGRSRLRQPGRVIDRIEPQAVINCIGIIKQLPTASDPVLNLTINSLLPHRLQQPVSGARGAAHSLQHRLRLQRPKGAIHRGRSVGCTRPVRTYEVSRRDRRSRRIDDPQLGHRPRVDHDERPGGMVSRATRACRPGVYSCDLLGVHDDDDGADRALDSSRSPRALPARCRYPRRRSPSTRCWVSSARPSASRSISCPTKRCRWIVRSTPRGSGR